MTISKGMPYPLGAQQDRQGVNFAFVSAARDCGVVLFAQDTLKEWKRIPFREEDSLGDIHCLHVSDISRENIAYCFYEEEKLVPDVRGRAFLGGHVYGEKEEGQVRLALLPPQDFDWEEDKNPRIPYEESICYCLHVRGFTRHASSKVKAKGTFRGLAEKIPYLKELGVTALELQPAYEFSEIEYKKGAESPFVDREAKREEKLNYWGYTEGFYYSPKNSYASAKDAVTEFKETVKLLHRNGMEIILQFYFTEDMQEQEILEILRYWVMTYHVDGFHLKGEHIVPGMLASDPALARTKLWYYGFPEKQPAQTAPSMRYLAEYRDDYRYDMRRFLKGDEGMLPALMYHLKHNPAGCGQINYLTNYDGFTLMDLVSYDRKHNEENGEDNKDGTDYNASWNCGQEGATRKKTVLALRLKQIKNALMLLFLSQGTPLLFMGDEFGNTQEGNNNPYCLDNKITWLNWANMETKKEIYEFTKELIALRKAHPVLRQEKEVRLMDYGACGYPDASYHGEVPWKPDTAGYSRQLGVMYCGLYAYRDKRTPDDFFYVAYNMHWEPHRYAMPNLPRKMQWKLCMAADGRVEDNSLKETQQEIEVPARCICLFKSQELPPTDKKEEKKKGRPVKG